MCYYAVMNIKDLIKLAGDQGKVLVIGDDGEMKGVFLSYADYQKLSGQTQTAVAGPDPEKINREILEAQLKENIDASNKNLEVIAPPLSAPTPIANILSERARDLFVSHPYGRQEAPLYDLREEVMDPNFNKPMPPQVDVDNEEEIKPNFDDI